MGISPETYRTSWDVHAWVGVIVGLFSTIMFGTGAAVVFHEEIESWQDPYAQEATPESDYEQWTNLAVEAFESKPPRQFTLWIPDGERGFPRVGYFSAETGRYRMEWIDPAKEEVVPQREKLGTLLFHVHTLYDVRFTYLYDFSGVLALVLLLVIVTGVIIQWERLVAQFQQFRADAEPFVRWNDLHKVIGVSTLPFQLFYAYSAALIVLAPFFVGAVTGPMFGGDPGAARNASYGRLPPPESGEPTTDRTSYRSVNELVEKARRTVPGLEVTKIMFRNWRRANARVDVEGGIEGDRFAHGIVRFDPTEGEIVRTSSPSGQTWAADLRTWIAEIHSVHFGGLGTKLLFALLSLACAGSMIAGMVVWLARRKRLREATIDHVLEKLTAGVGTGILVAVASVFAASRLLPWEMQGRLGAEELAYYLPFLGCVLGAFFVEKTKQYWRMQLATAGMLFGATPLLATRHSMAGLAGLATSDGTGTIPGVLGVDIGLAVVAVVLLGTARLLGDDPEIEPGEAT